MKIAPKEEMPAAAEEGTEPVQILIKREDVVALLLLQEQKKRMAAEQRALDAEQSLLLHEQDAINRRMSEEYGVDMGSYSVNVSSGVATPKPKPTPAPAPAPKP